MIPEKIKIGYKEYRLEKWKQTVASANEAQGQFFAKEGIIGYTDDEKGVSHANTLLHEIIHSIVYQWNIPKKVILNLRRNDSKISSSPPLRANKILQILKWTEIRCKMTNIKL